jgi:hypothetical protein
MTLIARNPRHFSVNIACELLLDTYLTFLLSAIGYQFVIYHPIPNRRAYDGAAYDQIHDGGDAQVRSACKLSRNAWVKSADEYKKMYNESITDPDGFWGKIAKDFFWYKPWNKVRSYDFKDKIEISGSRVQIRISLSIALTATSKREKARRSRLSGRQ